jgi:hypothetical protein
MIFKKALISPTLYIRRKPKRLQSDCLRIRRTVMNSQHLCGQDLLQPTGYTLCYFLPAWLCNNPVRVLSEFFVG